MYHRVANTSLDPWRLCVSPDRFARQIESLANHFEIISLADVPYRDDLQNTVALTFDDGYTDNLLIAKPILEKFSAPATVFVTTGYITAGREYWWDELEQIFLFPGILPGVLDMSSVGLGFHYEFSGSRSYSEDHADSYKAWKVKWDGSKPPTERHKLFLDVWNFLVGLNETVRSRAIEFLFEWSGAERNVRSSHQPLDARGLRALTEGGLIQVGSHTVTHPDLTALTKEQKIIELGKSKRDLDSLLNSEIKAIAYPHGRYDQETLNLSRDAGYEVVLGTDKAGDFHCDKVFQLSRKMVLNQDVEKFLARIQ